MSDINVTVTLPVVTVSAVVAAAPTVALIADTGPSGPNEIHIGPDYPTDPNVEMWWRTDSPTAHGWDVGAWDVDVWGA